MFYAEHMNRSQEEGGNYTIHTVVVGDYEMAQTLATDFLDKYNKYQNGPRITRRIRQIRAEKAAWQLREVAKTVVTGNTDLYQLEVVSGLLEPDFLSDSSSAARAVLSGDVIRENPEA